MIRGLASLLLVMVVVTHYAYEPLAGFYASQRHAAQAIFYALRGVEGALLYCIVWSLTPFRPLQARLAVSVVCAWGALEEAQTAVCMAAKGFGGKASTPAYAGLCDAVTGWPIYMITLLVVLMLFAFQYTKSPP
jgi:hypothetical protein